jgi:hypothetical protein
VASLCARGTRQEFAQHMAMLRMKSRYLIPHLFSFLPLVPSQLPYNHHATIGCLVIPTWPTRGLDFSTLFPLFVTCFPLVSTLTYCSTLKGEVVCSSQISVDFRWTK